MDLLLLLLIRSRHRRQQVDVDFPKVREKAGTLNTPEAARNWIAKLRESSSEV